MLSLCFGTSDKRAHPVKGKHNKLLSRLAVVVCCHGIVAECWLLQRDVASRTSINLQRERERVRPQLACTSQHNALSMYEVQSKAAPQM